MPMAKTLRYLDGRYVWKTYFWDVHAMLILKRQEYPVRYHLRLKDQLYETCPFTHRRNIHM